MNYQLLGWDTPQALKYLSNHWKRNNLPVNIARSSQCCELNVWTITGKGTTHPSILLEAANAASVQ